ncbi:transducin beta-like protein 3 isoform X2 [Leptinotarsa decemlineata]|uniref:transducin beta-like protein 3 isoform X2 n=1 Tax=Leptinotarsa decemlineata TaxID=7539 RepID=UPI003D30608C
MGSKLRVKEAFELESKHGAFYTGGNVEWFEDTLYCQNNSNISLLNTENGVVSKTIGEENSEDADSIQTFTTNGQQTVSSHKSGLLKLWNQNGEIEKMWKYIHLGPIAKLALKDNKLASGGSDSIVRIWDLQYQACILSLKGCQGVINVVEYHPIDDFIFASGDDGKINCYELNKGELKCVYNAHYSKVTSVVFSHDNQHFISCARDKVLILWEFGNPVPLKTLPVQEAVEVIVSLPKKFQLPDFKSDPSSIYVASAGERGVVRVWDVTKSKEVFVQTNSLVTPASEEGCLAISNIKFHRKLKALALVTVDQNIIIYHLKSFVCLKQFIGFSDEILDITYVGKDDSHLAVATNSNDIKLYCNTTLNCQILKGHTDIVLSLCTNKIRPDLMISSGKDNTVRLWLLEGSTNSMSCIGIGLRHGASVGSVNFSQTTCNFAVSASQDTCLKMWEIPTEPKKNNSLYCSHTTIAHEKDINSVAVSPNDKIIATASQDKTAKIWTTSLELVGILKGHKRGVWSIRFSPVDQVVVTSSADCTVKLWSVADLSCLKTFQGHDASVIRAEFIASGMQILSAGADGLLKLFSIKTSECVCTLDQHSARIWALAIKQDETAFVTGGSDSVLIKWKDVTQEVRLKRIEEAEELAKQEQKLNNYLMEENFLKALKLALKLDRPRQVLMILQSVKNSDSDLAETIKKLRNDQKESLFKMAINWNMNGKNCHSGILVMNILMKDLQEGDFRPVGLTSLLEAALPYLERNFKRLEQQMKNSELTRYIINCMKPHAKCIE